MREPILPTTRASFARAACAVLHSNKVRSNCVVMWKPPPRRASTRVVPAPPDPFLDAFRIPPAKKEVDWGKGRCAGLPLAVGRRKYKIPVESRHSIIFKEWRDARLYALGSTLSSTHRHPPRGKDAAECSLKYRINYSGRARLSFAVPLRRIRS